VLQVGQYNAVCNASAGGFKLLKSGRREAMCSYNHAQQTFVKRCDTQKTVVRKRLSIPKQAETPTPRSP